MLSFEYKQASINISCAIQLYMYYIMRSVLWWDWLFFSVLDGESPLQEYPCKWEGDADLLHLHGEEQQEPPGPERRQWQQTSGLKLPVSQ